MHDNQLQYFCLENPHTQGNLSGYRPWSRKGSDMTEWLITAQHGVSQLWLKDVGSF